MTRILAALLLLLLAPAAAFARPGDRDTAFGRRGTVTLKAPTADAVGGAVKVISGNRVLAGGAAAGQFVVVRLRPTGTLDSRFGTRGQVVPALPGTTLDGVRALATFRDGRIVAAGTLRESDGTTRMVAIRLLPTGEIDPSFGGAGYVLAGPNNAELGAMTMDLNGNVYLGGFRSGDDPIVIRLLPDGSTDSSFGSDGTFDGADHGLQGRVTSLLVRREGTLTFSVGGGTSGTYASTFTVVRVGATGALDSTWAGNGISSIVLGAGEGAGIGATALRQGPAGTTLVAGTDLTPGGMPRGTVVRLTPAGTPDTRFGTRGTARIARAGQPFRIKAMARDRSGRILLAGTGPAPKSLVMRLRANGRRDTTFGNGGLTLPVLGRPPGGNPIYTTFDAIDAAGAKAVIAGSAAGPGALVRSPSSGTAYQGRFGLTVTRLK